MPKYQIQKLQNQNGMTFEPIRTWFVEADDIEAAMNAADEDAGEELDWTELGDAFQGIEEGDDDPEMVWEVIDVEDLPGRDDAILPKLPAEFYAVVTHEDWEEGVIFYGATAQEAEDKAERFMLEETAYMREGVEDNDEEWLEIMKSEGWSLKMASLKED